MVWLGKGKRQRPVSVTEERNQLGWELLDKSTSPERKEEILNRIEELKQLGETFKEGKTNENH